MITDVKCLSSQGLCVIPLTFFARSTSGTGEAAPDPTTRANHRQSSNSKKGTMRRPTGARKKRRQGRRKPRAGASGGRHGRRRGKEGRGTSIIIAIVTIITIIDRQGYHEHCRLVHIFGRFAEIRTRASQICGDANSDRPKNAPDLLLVVTHIT